MKKYSILSLIFLLIIGGSVYANFQLRERLPAQTSDTTGPYQDQITSIEDNSIEIMYTGVGNEWEDNFFRGYYFDPAHGRFNLATSTGDRVTIGGVASLSCDSGYTARNISGKAISDYFGEVDFDSGSVPGGRDSVYICIPDDTSIGDAYLRGYTYSPHIGYQSFEGIQISSTVEGADNDADSRRLRVIGIATSANPEDTLGDQFVSDVRVFGNISKVDLRTLMQRNVQTMVRNITPVTGDTTISSTQLGNQTWGAVSGANRLQNNRVLYAGRDTGENIVVQGGVLSANANKTLIVQGANVYITGDIRGDGILGIIALQENGVGGNIYIHPTVTDIHAFLYADRSVISYNGSELDGNTSDSALANQLYIKGVLFSENTIGGSVKSTPECPFYVASGLCTTMQQAMKYDLNYLRRYQIAPDRDAEGDIIPDSFSPAHGAAESYMGNNTRNGEAPQRTDLREFPVILEYDSRIASNAPPLFSR
ncbi:hypothetical protein LAT59_03070 [Candidatus Gracilibacteria bacterium]|nr:hypothetical protein [Candidatus Gracilibacteria bacterium]